MIPIPHCKFFTSLIINDFSFTRLSIQVAIDRVCFPFKTVAHS